MRLKQVTIIFASIFLFQFSGHYCFAQKHEEFQWVEQQYQSVLEQRLPFDGKAYLSFRVYGDSENDILEYSYSVIAKEENKVELLVRRADSISLFYQVLALHHRNPTEKLNSMLRKLRIKEWRINDELCPGLKKQVSRFYELSLPTSSKEDQEYAAGGGAVVTLHPTTYYFEAYISGGSLRVKLWNDVDKQPFVIWANETRKMVEGCISKGGI